MKHVATTSGGKSEFESFLNFSHLCRQRSHRNGEKVILQKFFIVCRFLLLSRKGNVPKLSLLHLYFSSIIFTAVSDS